MSTRDFNLSWLASGERHELVLLLREFGACELDLEIITRPGLTHSPGRR